MIVRSANVTTNSPLSSEIGRRFYLHLSHSANRDSQRYQHGNLAIRMGGLVELFAFH